jgi:hypothetical protein
MAWHGRKTLNETTDRSHDTDVLLKETIGGAEMVFSLIKNRDGGDCRTKLTMKRRHIMYD